MVLFRHFKNYHLESMQVQCLFELLGTGFFAISGALVANQKSSSDWFGVTFIGFVTAIGGGSLRDVLLGSYPIVWIGDVHFIYAIFIGVFVAHIFYRFLERLTRTLVLLVERAKALKFVSDCLESRKLV